VFVTFVSRGFVSNLVFVLCLSCVFVLYFCLACLSCVCLACLACMTCVCLAFVICVLSLCLSPLTYVCLVFVFVFLSCVCLACLSCMTWVCLAFVICVCLCVSLLWRCFCLAFVLRVWLVWLVYVLRLSFVFVFMFVSSDVRLPCVFVLCLSCVFGLYGLGMSCVCHLCVSLCLSPLTYVCLSRVILSCLFGGKKKPFVSKSNHVRSFSDCRVCDPWEHSTSMVVQRSFRVRV
jgi:hypothetical protein